MSAAISTTSIRALWRRTFSADRPVRSFEAEPWNIDEVSVDKHRVTVRGWAFPDRKSRPGEGFLINGARPDVIDYPVARPDVGFVFWRRTGSGDSGFRLVARHFGKPYPGGILSIARPRVADGSPESGRDLWCYPDPALHLDLPDEDRRFRVIGNREATGFLATGLTDFIRLEHATRALFGRRIAEFGRILDWGVGCGRVARHLLLASPAADLVGCDIDRDNVDWCARNLPRGKFVASDLQPPLPFPDGHFHCVYGISVFTHLRLPLETAWLAELRRVIAPGGIALMTVHGATALEFMALKPEEWRSLRKRIAAEGLCESSPNAQLDGFVERPDEYVNVFHSRKHVAEKWRRYFDIVRIIPGYVFTHDLVVLRRR